MNRILAILAGVLLCASVQAAGIPASVSGDYTGSGWNCRILAFVTAQSPVMHRSLEAQCTGPDNRQRLATVVHLGCPQTGAAIPLYAHAGTPTNTPTLRINAVAASGLAVTFDGVPVTLALQQVVASPAPYTGCGAAPKPFGAYCASYIGCDW